MIDKMLLQQEIDANRAYVLEKEVKTLRRKDFRAILPKPEEISEGHKVYLIEYPEDEEIPKGRIIASISKEQSREIHFD